mmetsp:Transcript_63812/g.116524  ORF Transcript_63812/g.116524 Transcript_63812/m.116524 type:complete len:81 (-) Transcript_63812:353-595(-)
MVCTKTIATSDVQLNSGYKLQKNMLARSADGRLQVPSAQTLDPALCRFQTQTEAVQISFNSADASPPCSMPLYSMDPAST